MGSNIAHKIRYYSICGTNYIKYCVEDVGNQLV